MNDHRIFLDLSLGILILFLKFSLDNFHISLLPGLEVTSNEEVIVDKWSISHDWLWLHFSQLKVLKSRFLEGSDFP